METRTLTLRPTEYVLSDEQERIVKSVTNSLPSELMTGYTWHDAENEQKFLELARGLCLSVEVEFGGQAYNHAQELRWLYEKDRAAKIQAFINKETGLKGQSFYRPLGLGDDIPGLPNPYTQTISEEWEDTPKKGLVKVTRYWEYRKLEEYGPLLPSGAFRAVKKLREAGYVPDEYWVRTLKEKRDYRAAYLPDPELLGAYSLYLVVVAAWD
jgi:hypothetical protein